MNHTMHAEALLSRLFQVAVASAQPAVCVPPHLPTQAFMGDGRLVVMGQ